MDATLLSTNSNLLDFNSVPPIAQLRRCFFSIRLNQLTHERCSQLSRLRSGCSASGFGSVVRRNIQPQFSAKGGYWKSHAVPGGASDAAALSSDAIVLHVRGMLCEGCVASVQRILESQEPVSSASVNLKAEKAIVWPVSDAKVEPGWQKNLGQALAKHLTSCGFESNIRGGQFLINFLESSFSLPILCSAYDLAVAVLCCHHNHVFSLVMIKELLMQMHNRRIQGILVTTIHLHGASSATGIEYIEGSCICLGNTNFPLHKPEDHVTQA